MKCIFLTLPSSCFWVAGTRREKGGEALGPLHPERMGIGDYAMHHCGPVTALAIYDKYDMPTLYRIKLDMMETDSRKAITLTLFRPRTQDELLRLPCVRISRWFSLPPLLSLL